MTTIEKIAKAAGCETQTIRLLLQRKDCVFGTAIKREGSKHYTYILYPEKVKELFGVRMNDTTNYSGNIGSRNSNNASAERQAAT